MSDGRSSDVGLATVVVAYPAGELPSVMRMTMCGLAALTLLCGCRRDISGTYLAGDTSGSVWLQLVRTPDNHLTGQFVVSVLKPDGRIDRNSTAVTGAVDGENVSLSGGGLFGLQSTTFSGTLNGDTLTLTGEQPQPLVLKRSSLGAYQAEMNVLEGRAQGIIAANANAEAAKTEEREQRRFVSSVDRLLVQMQRFNTTTDMRLGKFRTIEGRYESITAKMNSYIERERHLAGKSDAAVDRSELYVDANQAALDTTQLHLDAQSMQRDFESNAKPIADGANNLENECRTFDVSHGGSTTTEIGHNAACGRLLLALPLFHQNYEAMNAGLTHLEQVYKQQNDAQQSLLKTAQELQ